MPEFPRRQKEAPSVRLRTLLATPLCAHATPLCVSATSLCVSATSLCVRATPLCVRATPLCVRATPLCRSCHAPVCPCHAPVRPCRRARKARILCVLLFGKCKRLFRKIPEQPSLLFAFYRFYPYRLTPGISPCRGALNLYGSGRLSSPTQPHGTHYSC